MCFKKRLASNRNVSLKHLFNQLSTYGLFVVAQNILSNQCEGMVSIMSLQFLLKRGVFLFISPFL